MLVLDMRTGNFLLPKSAERMSGRDIIHELSRGMDVKV